MSGIYRACRGAAFATDEAIAYAQRGRGERSDRPAGGAADRKTSRWSKRVIQQGHCKTAFRPRSKPTFTYVSTPNLAWPPEYNW